MGLLASESLYRRLVTGGRRHMESRTINNTLREGEMALYRD